MGQQPRDRRRTVVVADGNLRVAVLLAELLEDECDLRVVGICADAPRAVAVVQQHRPDLVLVAERLRATSGTALCRVLRLVSPDTALVLRCDAAAPRSPAPSLADAVVPGDATFRRLARVLYDAATHAPAAAGDGSARAPAAGVTGDSAPPPSARVAARPAAAAGASGAQRMQLDCSDCGVDVQVDAADMAAVVEQARAFFLAHDGCHTSLDLVAAQRAHRRREDRLNPR